MLGFNTNSNTLNAGLEKNKANQLVTDLFSFSNCWICDITSDVRNRIRLICILNGTKYRLLSYFGRRLNNVGDSIRRKYTSQLEEQLMRADLKDPSSFLLCNQSRQMSGLF